jgi:hypothetical protein
MASGKAVYCFDIDGTLCTQRSGDYDRAEPWPDRIAVVNSLWDAGHRIILYTARGSGTGIDWRAITEAQLRTWNVRYHELWFGKPPADIFIDDRAVTADGWFAAREPLAGGEG